MGAARARGPRPFIGLVVVLFTSGLFLSIGQVAAKAGLHVGEDPPLTLEPAGSIDVSSAAQTLLLSNASNTDLPVVVTLVPPKQLVSRASLSVTTALCSPQADAGAGSHCDFVLPAAGSVKIVLDLSPRSKVPEVSTGTLSVATSPPWIFGGYATTRSISYASSKPTPKPSPKFAVTEWTTSKSWGPFAKTTGLDIPIVATVSCAELALPAPGTRIGTVSKGETYGTVLYDGCRPAPSDTATPATTDASTTTSTPAVKSASLARAGSVTIRLEGLPPHGAAVYEGKVDLTPDDEKNGDSITLKVEEGSSFLWPTLLLFLSIVVALIVAHLRTTRPPLAELKAQTYSIEGRVGASSGDDESVIVVFNRVTDNRFVGYDFAKVVTDEAAALRKRIVKLNVKKPFTLSATDTELVALTSDVAALSNVVDRWPEFGRDLARLTVALAVVDATGELPRFADWVRDTVFNADWAKKTADLGPFIDTVAVARSVAEDWSGSSIMLRKAIDRVADLRAHASEFNSEERAAIATADGDLSEAQLAFGRAQLPAEVVAVRDGALKKAFSSVDRLAHLKIATLRALLYASSGSAEAGRAVDKGFLSSLLPAALLVGAPARERAASIRRTTSVIGWLLIALFLGIAIWSGLVALYFDKQWGTGQNVVTTLLWGLTGGLVAVPLAAVIEEQSASRTA